MATPDHEVEVEVQSEEAACARHDVGVGLGSGQPLPLNPKRLTGVLLKQVARGLEIPSMSSGDELRTMIEGKLGDLGHDPRNSQVMLQEAETGVNIGLQDAAGVFLIVKPLVADLGKHDDPPGETVDGTGDETGVVDELRAALREAQEEQVVRDREIARLHEQLEKEKERYKKLWSLNCAQLAEFDGTISAKDEEIERLKSRLHSVSDESSLPRGSPLRTPLEGETEDILPAHQRGRAPPVEMFSGEDGENTLDDWLPALV